VAQWRHRQGQRDDGDVHQAAQAYRDRQGREGRHRRRLCAFLARFKNGSLATFESTRYARGHKALYTFEINGEHASIFWDLHDLHRLQYFDHRDEGRVRGWRNIHVTDGDHPYMGKWWVPGLQIGYEHSFVHQLADFLEGLAKGKPAHPTFRDALETQYVCDAVLKSAKTDRWEKVANAKQRA
jgi:predicted dehydrogenase